jgi:urea transport system permease protein
VRQLQQDHEEVFRPELQIASALAALCLLAGGTTASAQTSDEALRAAVVELRDAGFSDKEAIVGRLAASGHRRAPAVLTALLEDRLYVRSADGQVFITASADDTRPTQELIDPATGAAAGSSPVSGLARIGTNNRLRRVLRTTVARFALANPDPAVRLAAIADMLRSLDEMPEDLLRQRLAVESDSAVKRQIETGLALKALGDADAAVRLGAVGALSSGIGIDARNRLAALLERRDDGSYAEPDEQVRKAAAAAVASIDSARSIYSGIETLFFGLSLGSVLVLAAIGLAITFGVMGVINMAHGELMMLGAYTTYVVQTAMPGHLDWSIPLAIPAAFVVAGLVGMLLERTVIRFLYGRPLETLLATFGVSLVLQQLVRTVFTANNRAVATPSWMSGQLQVNEALAITYNRIYIVGFTVVVFVVLLLALHHTRLGLHIRAVAQNRDMARVMGIRSARVDALTFGLGAGIAGVAGVALSQLTNVGPNLGQAYIIDSFMVVVFGGVGNLWGTLIGGLSLGMIDKLLEPLVGAVLGKIAVLVTLILFIQRRPRGLFPQAGRAAESS